MLPITQYLLQNPMVAFGLVILIALCIYNVLRRQTRVAMGAWLLILVVLFYIYTQASRPGVEEPDLPDLPKSAMEDLVQP